MPSRRGVALIVIFWLSVTGYTLYRDVWPVLFASGPPPIAIDLADEAAQNLATHWTITYNGKEAGRLLTQMRYVDADDTFRFTHDYKQLRYDAGGFAVVVPELQVVVRITRAGDLREQSADGKMEIHAGDITLGTATAKVTGTVTDGQLTAACDVTLTIAGKPLTVNRKLDPVPVPAGQPLNPLQPVNRIAGVKPGRRWAVHESNPLDDVMLALAAEYGLKLPEQKRGPLIGEVQPSPQELQCRDETVSCWVIEYRREAELEARTWVRVSDGKVMKQEAFHKGDTLAIDRDE